MESTMIFGISPIFALLPLIIYIILAFKDINPVLNVVICVVLSAIMTKQPFSSMGEVLGSALGSFLGIIGFIIMLGSGPRRRVKGDGSRGVFNYDSDEKNRNQL